jgi:hypothetical protein
MGWRDTIVDLSEGLPQGAEAASPSLREQIIGWREPEPSLAVAPSPRSEAALRPETAPKEIGALEAAGRGALQGATLGFSDEIYGGGKALLDSLIEGDFEGFGDRYRSERDAVRRANEEAERQNPNAYLGGNIAGSLATSVVPGLNIAKAGTLAGRAAMAGALGAGAGLGVSEADLTKGEFGRAALDTALGGALGAGFQVGGEKVLAPVAKAAGEGFQKLRQLVPRQKKIEEFLSGKAARLAENATGATAKQAEKFVGKPGETGRELLERGIVRFGDSAKDIAERAEKLMAQDGERIGEILAQLDEKGITIPKLQLINSLRRSIGQLKKDPSQIAVVRQLENIVDSIKQMPRRRNPSLSEAEATKRGFQALVKGGWTDPNAQIANKTAARVYREAVERAAKKASPKLAKVFSESKKQYQLLAPVEEAAARRAGQLNQMPIGGLLDIATVGAGTLLGPDSSQGAAGGLLAAGMRRALAPRIAASSAVTLDRISKALRKNPGVVDRISNALINNPASLGKYAKPLSEAAMRGNKALAATQYILQQRDPEFQEVKRRLEEEER